VIDMMFGVFETSLIMSVAIVVIALATKLLQGQIKASGKHLVWLLIAAALLFPVRPFEIKLPLLSTASPSETHMTDNFYSTDTEPVPIYYNTMFGMWRNFRTASPIIVPTTSQSAGSPIELSTEPATESATMPASEQSAGTVIVRNNADASGSDRVQDPTPAQAMAEMHRGVLNSMNPISLLHFCLFVTWLTGVMIYTGILISRHRRFMSSMRYKFNEVNDQAVLKMLTEIQTRLKVKRHIQLMSCPLISTPFVVGLVRSKIILPEFALTENSEQLRLMLVHEVLHIKRGDLFTRLLCLIACAVHWFNPLVHLMVRKTIEAAEQATDDSVLRYIGEDSRFRYGETLLTVVKAGNILRNKTVLAYGLTSSGKNIKKRLENIVKGRRIPRYVWLSCTAILLTITLSFAMVGCSDSAKNDLGIGGSSGTGGSAIGNASNNTAPPDVSHMVEPDRSLFAGETLTIVLYEAHRISQTALKYMDANPGVTIKLIELLDHTILEYDKRQAAIDKQLEELRVQFMAGYGPVLLLDVFDYSDPRMTPYMTDWFPVMNADPGFNEDDWLMNVFNSVADNGKLYGFPVSFNYELVTVNSLIPGLRERISGRNSITNREMLELYQEFAGDTDLLFDREFDASRVLFYDLNKFIDVEANRVDINNEEFIDLIKKYKELTSPDSAWFGPGLPRIIITPPIEQRYNVRYLYTIVHSYTSQYFLDFTIGPLFLERVPIVNERGNLLINTYNNYALNANATSVEQALAWDFIKFMSDPENFTGLQIMPNSAMPTNKAHLRAEFEQNSMWTIDQLIPYHWELDGTYEEVIERGLALQEAFSDMPMERFPYLNVPRSVSELIFEALMLFNDGVVSAEQTAADLQNQVELLLMEMGVR